MGEEESRREKSVRGGDGKGCEVEQECKGHVCPEQAISNLGDTKSGNQMTQNARNVVDMRRQANT